MPHARWVKNTCKKLQICFNHVACDFSKNREVYKSRQCSDENPQDYSKHRNALYADKNNDPTTRNIPIAKQIRVSVTHGFPLSKYNSFVLFQGSWHHLIHVAWWPPAVCRWDIDSCVSVATFLILLILLKNWSTAWLSSKSIVVSCQMRMTQVYA